MIRLVLIRHGETDWNVEGRMQGQKDRPLNDRGRKQAELTGQYVRNHFQPEVVWSSDLARCVSTAEPLGFDFQKSELLREINYGTLEGKTWAETSREEQAESAEYGSDPYHQMAGGESRADLVERAAKFMAVSEITKLDGDVVIVGHGASLSGMLTHLLGLPPEAAYKFQLENASVTTLNITPELTRLTALSLATHLEAVNEAVNRD
jgi:broad specificity phosphatase PhoE